MPRASKHPKRRSATTSSSPRRAPAGRRARSRRSKPVPARPPVQLRRALLSVYEKDGVVELARGLVDLGVHVLTTGGTARLLIDNGVPVERIAQYTNFPEMLDGRVKTLHPKIHAGIMAVRDNRKHMSQIRRLGIPMIDLVVVNLYPFEKTAAMEGIGFDEIVEMIDIGGPSLVRAAAKNFRDVAVVVDPADYEDVLETLRDKGNIPASRRFDLAKKAFLHVASYDMAVHSYLSLLNPDGTLAPANQESGFPLRLTADFLKVRDLRYGENPHQRAAFYREPEGNAPTVANAEQLHGKELSFNNILDLDAAFRIACDFDRPACAAVKHMNPCGVGTGRGAAEAFARARDADPLSIFGGIAGFNVAVDLECARALSELFLEAVIAPEFSPEALEILRSRKTLRIMRTAARPLAPPSGKDMRRVAGGLLVQDWDSGDSDPHRGKIVTRRRPTPRELEAMHFAWKVVRHVRSNAIVYATADRTLGIGAGQMSRVDSVRFGAMKAAGPLKGAAIASDGFFPFRDSIDEAAAHGVTAIVQPGGSIRDAEVTAAADEHGMTMILTGFRHFRH